MWSPFLARWAAAPFTQMIPESFSPLMTQVSNRCHLLCGRRGHVQRERYLLPSLRLIQGKAFFIMEIRISHGCSGNCHCKSNLSEKIFDHQKEDKTGLEAILKYPLIHSLSLKLVFFFFRKMP